MISNAASCSFSSAGNGVRSVWCGEPKRLMLGEEPLRFLARAHLVGLASCPVRKALTSAALDRASHS
jgi:hypothetical protein